MHGPMTHRSMPWAALVLACTTPSAPHDAAMPVDAFVPRDSSTPPRDAWAPPGAIAEITGSIAEGQVIRITGSGFGANGPSIEVFDDFERGEADSVIGVDSPAIGTWD